MELNAYDPTPEAIALLEKYEPMVVVKGLLTQLGACRQTKAINQEWINDRIELLEECFEVSEKAKQLLRDKGYGWTGLDILETCKLVPENETQQ